jgi:hypothetical protein
MAQIQPKREIKKGDGKWVNEILMNPMDDKVLKVVSYTEEQLLEMKENTKKQYEANTKLIDDMLALLK